jgi:ABC-type Fe3+ transport system permease subunit
MLTLVSLTTKDSFFFTPVWSTSNYSDIANTYSLDFQVTFILVVGAAFLDILLGYPFAYIMSRRVKRFSDAFRAIMLVPLFGELYIAYGFYYLLFPGGPLSFLFNALGIPIFKALYSTQSAAIALAVYTFPFAVYNIGISLQGIDRSIEDAARCLGAGAFGTFFRVTLPMSMPGILGAWLVSIGWGLGAFAIPALLGGAMVSQRVLSIEIYSIALLQLNFGTAAAIGVLLTIISLIIFYVSLRASRGALI